MNREEFETRVEASAPPDLRGSDQLKAPIFDIGRRGGPFYNSDVSDAIQEAGRRCAKEAKAGEQIGPRQARRPQSGAEAHFISRLLVQSLKPWTEGLREEGFGSSDPPYQDDEDAAADYIERTSAEDLARWREFRSNGHRDLERLHQLANRLGLDVKASNRFLPYGRVDDDFRKTAPVSPGTFLSKLAGEVERVARGTGLPPDALTAHVLTGALPVMSRVRGTDRESYFRLPSGQQAQIRSVTLTFRTADLTFDELRSIYDGIKIHMGGKGIQAPTLEDLEFWDLVQEMGGPPEPYNGVRKFWQCVLSRWNRAHPEREPLKSW